MNKQYIVTVSNSVGNSFIATVFAENWSAIPDTIKDLYGSDFYVYEYLNTPRDFCERYPMLINDRIRKQEETKRNMRKLFGK